MTLPILSTSFQSLPPNIRLNSSRVLPSRSISGSGDPPAPPAILVGRESSQCLSWRSASMPPEGEVPQGLAERQAEIPVGRRPRVPSECGASRPSPGNPASHARAGRAPWISVTPRSGSMNVSPPPTSAPEPHLALPPSRRSPSSNEGVSAAPPSSSTMRREPLMSNRTSHTSASGRLPADPDVVRVKRASPLPEAVPERRRASAPSASPRRFRWRGDECSPRFDDTLLD